MKRINTLDAPKAIGPYSQAVQLNNLLFVSGQIGIEPKSGNLIQDNFPNELSQVLENIKAVLKAANLTLNDIVRLDIFLTDITNFEALNVICDKYFHPDHLPARQTVEVTKLPKNARVEISCIARVNS